MYKKLKNIFLVSLLLCASCASCARFDEVQDHKSLPDCSKSQWIKKSKLNPMNYQKIPQDKAVVVMRTFGKPDKGALVAFIVIPIYIPFDTTSAPELIFKRMADNDGPVQNFVFSTEYNSDRHAAYIVEPGTYVIANILKGSSYLVNKSGWNTQLQRPQIGGFSVKAGEIVYIGDLEVNSVSSRVENKKRLDYFEINIHDNFDDAKASVFKKYPHLPLSKIQRKIMTKGLAPQSVDINKGGKGDS